MLRFDIVVLAILVLVCAELINLIMLGRLPGSVRHVLALIVKKHRSSNKIK